MHAFDPNDYRKRVLAAVERRGGPEESDAFELYDIPIAEAARLSDAEVAARVQQVWTLWQKLRDHPKFRVLAGLLVDAHRELSEPLLETGSRLIEADRVRQLRARREAERFEMLDAAIDRLVQRYGGVPAAKIPGLEDIGRMGGLTAAEIAAHVRRHRIIDESPTPAPPPAAPALSAERRRQIRKLLLELERLRDDDDPVPTLLYVLGLTFADAHHTVEIRFRAEALRARTRELPPGRLRVVLDELLIHIADLLEPGGDLVDAYLQTVIDDATDQLRPQVRAAVLVEDLLVAADFDYLLGEAITAGLDRATAERILVSLTDELGTVVEGREHLAAPPGGTAPGNVTPDGRSARGATPADSRRGGNTGGAGTAAARGSGDARADSGEAGARTPHDPAHGHGARQDLSGGDPSRGGTAAGRSAGRTADRTGSSAAADRSGRGSAGGYGARGDSGEVSAPASNESTETGGARQDSRRSTDSRGDAGAAAGGPSGATGEHRDSGGERAPRAPDPAHWQRTPYGRGGAQGDMTGATEGGSRAARPWEAALRAARGALRAGRPREAAGFVEDARQGVGDDVTGATSVRAVAEEVERVLAEAQLHWRAAVSACAGRRFVEALTEHLDFLERRALDVVNPDPYGASRESLSGRARAAVIQAGRMFEAAPPEPPAARLRAVLEVLEVCADHSEARAALARLQVAAPGDVTASRKPDGTVVIAWLASITEQVEYRVTRLLADGSWRVVGRTRGTALEDGGAGATGAVPVYGVVASVSGRTSDMARSDGKSPAETPGDTAEDERPSGMPAVRGLTEQRGLLVFEWPTGITEVMVVARPDAPPVDPEDPHARRWKVTNMRYELEGGVRIPPEIPRPCHIAIASCRRDPAGTLTVATAFASTARIRWVR